MILKDMELIGIACGNFMPMQARSVPKGDLQAGQVGARWGSRQFQVPAGVGTHEFPRSGEAGGVQEEGRI